MKTYIKVFWKRSDPAKTSGSNKIPKKKVEPPKTVII